jgi:hypothetical protein
MRPLWQRSLLVGGLFLALSAAAPSTARADEIPREYRETIDKGLKYLARQQHADGHWEGVNGGYVISMTSMAGMAMLAEGSTLREGKYRANIRRAVNFLMGRTQGNGLIGVAASQAEGGRYLYGHGYAMTFLASVVGEEHDAEMRAKLVQVLEKAAKFSRDAQTSRGGWGYVSAKDGSDFDEGSVTITQLQGLRAARNAGVIVPQEAIRDAQAYLKACTDDRGHVRYSLSIYESLPGATLSAAAVCCGFSYGEYQSELVKKWIEFARHNVVMPNLHRRGGHDEYTHYYFAQVVYVLGNDRYQKLFPDARSDEVLTWNEYRKELFDEYMRTQSDDGSWSSDSWTARMVGPTYVTACYLTVMQLDKGALPLYQR